MDELIESGCGLPVTSCQDAGRQLAKSTTKEIPEYSVPEAAARFLRVTTHEEGR